MLEVVAELEANGRSLQHFARELARYFRNLLVVKIAGSGHTRLVAARRTSSSSWRKPPRQFSEEDLTRYLQLTLDLFRDLQSSLQPRLHLEIGLLRMVHAGKLQSIEEAIAGWRPAGIEHRPPTNNPPSESRGGPRGSQVAQVTRGKSLRRLSARPRRCRPPLQ